MKAMEMEKKVTTAVLRCMKKKGEKISMLTAYDATFARLLDGAGVDAILVGDSLGMVIHGAENTLSVTLDDVIYHTRAVKKGIRRAHLVADMPFMSYQPSVTRAIESAGRLMKDGGAEAVKLEGGLEMAGTVRTLTSVGIPVMAHIGLKPQSIHMMGGYKIQGKSLPDSELLISEARAFEDAGAYSILLEGIAMETAAEITEAISIPTIGISSGPFCDGQVLVIYDLLGMDDGFAPRFVKRYAELSEVIKGAVSGYIEDVKGGAFPKEEHAFHRNLKILKPANIIS